MTNKNTALVSIVLLKLTKQTGSIMRQIGLSVWISGLDQCGKDRKVTNTQVSAGGRRVNQIIIRVNSALPSIGGR